MKEHLYRFDDEYEKEKPVGSFELGVVDVILDDIVGSVGRYRDFDNGFNIIGIDERSRLIADALRNKKELPPLELYKLKDHYFILDGHHRVLVARRMGFKSLKARVIEFLPPRNSFENILAREKSEFEYLTGLKDITLTEISQYEKLKNQIREHKHYLGEKEGKEVTFREASLDWHNTIYRPIAERISSEGIHKDFPGREIGDLYVYISHYKWMESQRRGYDIGFSAALEEFRIPKVDMTFKESIRDFLSTFWKISPCRTEFEELTGLRNIELSDEDSYPAFLKQIEEHKYYLGEKCGTSISLKEAASRWRWEIFEPITRILEEERYVSGFPRKTPADLYLMLSELKWLESEKRGYDIGFTEAFEELKKKKKASPASLRERIKLLLSDLKTRVNTSFGIGILPPEHEKE